MDNRVIIQQQAAKINQLQLALTTLGTFISRQQAVMRAASECLNVTDPNQDAIKARIKELLDAPPHGCVDEVIRQTVISRRLMATVNHMQKFIAEHKQADEFVPLEEGASPESQHQPE